MHVRGIVHRDLKPENVLITTSGRPLIVDLGVAKYFEDTDHTPGLSVSHSGNMTGTIGYMAPEQAMDAKTAGPPADVYAVGLVLYEALTGKPVFKGESVIEVLRELLGRGKPIEPITRIRPGTPPWLAEIVGRCLSRDPEDRYSDGAELARAIGGHHRPAPSVHPAVLATALALLFGAAILFGVALGRRSDAREEKPPPALVPVEVATPVSAAVAAPEFPAPCRGFLRGERSRLVSVWGRYGRRGAAGALAASLLPDGKTLVSAAVDGTVSFWELGTNAERHRVGATNEDAISVALSGDGDRLLLGCVDGKVELWKAGRLERVFTGHTGPVATVAFVPGKSLALSASDDQTLRLWDTTTGKPVRTLSGQASEVICASVAPDGEHALSGSPDGRALVWNLGTGELVATLAKTKSPVLCTAFLPGAGRALTGHLDGSILVWDVARREVVRTLLGHTDAVRALACTDDGKGALSGGEQGSLFFWDLEAAAMRERLPSGKKKVFHVELARDGRLGVVAADDGIALYDIEKGVEVSPAEQGSTVVESLAYSPDGARLLVGREDGGLDLVALPGGEGRALVGHRGPVHAASFSADGLRAISGAPDEGGARIWNVATGELVTSLPERSTLRIATFVGDGSRILLSSSHGTFRVRVLETGATLFEHHEPRPKNNDARPLFRRLTGSTRRRVIAASPDGTRLLMSNPEPGFRLWETSDDEPVFSTSDGGRLTAAALTASRALCAEADGAVTLWDLGGTHARLRSLDPAPTAVSHLAITPDGRRAVGSVRGGGVLLWGVDTGKVLDRLDLSSSADEASALAIAPDGRSFIVGTRRGVVLRFTTE